MKEGRRDIFIAVIGTTMLLGVLFIRTFVGGSQAPGEDSVDVGFAQDMQVHHAQGVEMAELLDDRSTDTEVQEVARDILLGQQAQIGEMRGWLEVWDRPVTSTDPPMEWASHHGGHTEGEMPGLATDDEVASLAAATGATADVLFLQLMIEHHEGGVHMASIAADDAGEPIVRKVARTIADSQQAELDLLRDLLEPRAAS